MITAARLLGELCNMNRFKTEAKLAMYSGLSPVSDDSGKRKGFHRTTHRANKVAKDAIMQIANLIDAIVHLLPGIIKKRDFSLASGQVFGSPTHTGHPLFRDHLIVTETPHETFFLDTHTIECPLMDFYRTRFRSLDTAFRTIQPLYFCTKSSLEPV